MTSASPECELEATDVRPLDAEESGIARRSFVVAGGRLQSSLSKVLGALGVHLTQHPSGCDFGQPTPLDWHPRRNRLAGGKAALCWGTLRCALRWHGRSCLAHKH